MKRKVVSSHNLPLKLPVLMTWVCALSQATWNMPGWLIGVMWMWVVLMWIVAVQDFWTRDDIDPFAKDKNNDE